MACLRMVEGIVTGSVVGHAAWAGFAAASNRIGLVPMQCSTQELELFLTGYMARGTAGPREQPQLAGQPASAALGASLLPRPPAGPRPMPPWRQSPPPEQRVQHEIVLKSRAASRPGNDNAVSCLELADPQAGGLTMHCGRYHLIQQRLQMHPGFASLLQLAHDKRCAFRFVQFTCRKGRHRSVAMAEIVAELCRNRSQLVSVYHDENPQCRVPSCSCSCGVPGTYDRAQLLPATTSLWDEFTQTMHDEI